jgi:hypothetical protein
MLKFSNFDKRSKSDLKKLFVLVETRVSIFVKQFISEIRKRLNGRPFRGNFERFDKQKIC